MQNPELEQANTPDASHAAIFYISLILVLIFGVGFLGILLVDLGIPHEGQLFTAIGGAAQALLIIGLVVFMIRTKKFDARKTLRLVSCSPTFIFWGAVGIVPLGMLVSQLAQVLVHFVPELMSENLVKLVESSAFAGDLPVYLFYSAVISVGAGISEELAFRGYILRGVQSAVRPWGAITISALVFALFHIEPLHILMVFPAGLYLGYLAISTGSIYPAIIAHAFNNLWSLIEVSFWQTTQPALTSEEILFSLEYPTEVLVAAAAILILALYKLNQHAPLKTGDKDKSS